MTVPTVLAITARRSCALCSASVRPAGEISAVVIGPLPFSVLSWRLAQAAGTPIAAMLSSRGGKRNSERGRLSTRQAGGGGLDRGTIGHRGLRAVREAGEPGGGAGLAQCLSQREPAIEPCRQHPDKCVAGAGCVDRLDHQRRRVDTPAIGEKRGRPRAAACDDERLPQGACKPGG